MSHLGFRMLYKILNDHPDTLAERAYARISRILNHQFREKKPLILFRSRTDFGQNNVTGDLGEGTGGVTEALRHRILLG